MQTPVEKIEEFCKLTRSRYDWDDFAVNAINEITAFARSLLPEEKEGIEKAWCNGVETAIKNSDGESFIIASSDDFKEYFTQTYKQ